MVINGGAKCRAELRKRRKDVASKLITVTGGKKIQRELTKINKLKKSGSVSIGWFKGATYPNGLPVATVAFINNYGALTKKGVAIPPRPFLDSAIQQYSREWFKTIEKTLKITKYNVKYSLLLAASQAVGDIQNTIKTWKYPPNSPATIAKKGYNNPLEDTRTMLKTIQSEWNPYSVKVEKPNGI